MKIELEKDEAVQIMPIEYPPCEECPIDAIREIMPLEEIMTQLAEEASELAQAALKYRRTMSNSNPTPITRREAEKKLLEEIADVKLCLHVSGFEAVRHKISVNRTISAKAERWLKRLTERVR
jgi:NTP pyrophosphatase (non-canonical NTP hydrolase)